MAVNCEFIDFIIPIKNIERVYPGGFAKFISDKQSSLWLVDWYDEHLFRTGAMNPIDIKWLDTYWTNKGLIGIFKEDGKSKWKDFAVCECMMGGCTLPCDWLEFDYETDSAYLKGYPPGEIVGPYKRYEKEDNEV